MRLHSFAVQQQGTTLKAWCIGVVAAIAFLSLSTVRLNWQGMYYDEAHQAPAAFFYIGEHPALFVYPVLGIPVLNMGYSGAIKSAVFGAYLRLTGAHFTVFSWRLLGLLFVAAGLLVFYRFVAVRLPIASCVLFLALILTDTSVILMTRHDWGPVALSMALRLVFIGLWISLENIPSSGKVVAIGILMGISLFEKLSAVVLLLPFIILLWSVRKRFSGALHFGAIGFGIGSLPLALVNLASLWRGTGLISFADVKSIRSFSIQGTIEYARNYLELGQGVGVREFILGESKSLGGAEAFLIMALIGIVLFGALRHWSNRWVRLSAYFAASYAFVGVALFLLPQETSVHHWILATPFQYTAVACAFAACMEKATELRAPAAAYRLALLASAMALIAIRVPNLAAVESAFAAGKTSERFHPDFNRVATLASERANNAVFVAADWGTATQIYCAANGKSDFVYELFWGSQPAADAVRLMSQTNKPNIYVVTTGIASEFVAASTSIIQAMTSAPGWQEVPVEKEFAELHHVKVRRFTRRNL